VSRRLLDDRVDGGERVTRSDGIAGQALVLVQVVSITFGEQFAVNCFENQNVAHCDTGSMLQAPNEGDCTTKQGLQLFPGHQFLEPVNIAVIDCCQNKHVAELPRECQLLSSASHSSENLRMSSSHNVCNNQAMLKVLHTVKCYSTTHGGIDTDATLSLDHVFVMVLVDGSEQHKLGFPITAVSIFCQLFESLAFSELIHNM
jgi:hypothetical protein